MCIIILNWLLKLQTSLILAIYGTPFRPILLDYRECHPSQPQDNLKKAFTVAMKLGMVKLIDPDEGLVQIEKERDREKQRQRETETERDRETETDRETERDRNRERETDTERETDRQRGRQTERDRQTETERDRQTERETDRQRQRVKKGKIVWRKERRWMERREA